ncbi:hypothetical protein J7E62_21360 [Variovorax paradoxus]|nr:hypothetical protein [Variovorax paradoxus]
MVRYTHYSFLVFGFSRISHRLLAGLASQSSRPGARQIEGFLDAHPGLAARASALVQLDTRGDVVPLEQFFVPAEFDGSRRWNFSRSSALFTVASVTLVFIPAARAPSSLNEAKRAQTGTAMQTKEIADPCRRRGMR